jgi:quinohemoprotein ethanol dehydrogenase
MAGHFDDRATDKAHWQFKPTQLNTGLAPNNGDAPPNAGTSRLVAWDPLTQHQRWSVPTPGVWQGGTLTTAGRLVFQGQADGHFNAYDAETGKLLWTAEAGIGISGAPITYSVDGHQYVTVVAGWGAAGPAYLGSLAAQHGWVARKHVHQLLTFQIDGKAKMPIQPPPELVTPLDDPTLKLEATRVAAGEQIYAQRCLACHGLAAVAGGFAPDLRASAVAMKGESFASVVRGGALELRNMPKFDELSAEDVENLRLYVRSRARETRAVGH